MQFCFFFPSRTLKDRITVLQGASGIIFPIIRSEGVRQMFFPATVPAYYRSPPVMWDWFDKTPGESKFFICRSNWATCVPTPPPPCSKSTGWGWMLQRITVHYYTFFLSLGSLYIFNSWHQYIISTFKPSGFNPCNSRHYLCSYIYFQYTSPGQNQLCNFILRASPLIMNTIILLEERCLNWEMGATLGKYYIGKKKEREREKGRERKENNRFKDLVFEASFCRLRRLLNLKISPKTLFLINSKVRGE